MPTDTPDPGTVVPNDPFGPIKTNRSKSTPGPGEVNALHARSDLDAGALSQHHTLGVKHNQAAAGDHKHTGVDSRKLMEGITVTGAKGGNAALTDLINKLSTALGFTNGTT